MATLLFAEICHLMSFMLLLSSFVTCKTASEEIEAANDKLDFTKIRFENNLFNTDTASVRSLQFADTDELLTAEQVKADNRVQPRNRTRRALLQKRLNRTWSGNTVPFVLDPTYSDRRKRFIKYMMKRIERISCVQFEEHIYPNIPSKPYVVITPNMTGCWSTVGMNIFNIVSLQDPECFRQGVVLHELLHVLGFRHEQSRADRDQHIKINWENIRPDKCRDFLKRSDVESLGENYDIRSVMHYHRTAFSKNGKPTLESLDPINKEMGGNWLTSSDIRQLRLLYNCPRTRYGYRNY